YRIFFWILEHYGEFMLYILLFIAVALTFLGGIVVGILNKNKMNHYFVQALTICITIVTTLFAITAIGGLFFILFPEMNLLVLYLFALIALILPGLFLKIPEQFRYSMLGTGSLLAFFSGLMDMSIFYYILLLFLLLFFIFIFYISFYSIYNYFFVLYLFAFIVLILPGLFLKIPEQFRYSMLGTGSLLAFFSGLMDMSIFYHILLLLPLLIGIYMIQHPGVRVLTYLFTNI